MTIWPNGMTARGVEGENTGGNEGGGDAKKIIGFAARDGEFSQRFLFLTKTLNALFLSFFLFLSLSSSSSSSAHARPLDQRLHLGQVGLGVEPEPVRADLVFF